MTARALASRLRSERIKSQLPFLRVREVSMWSVDNYVHLRYEYRFRDPASHQEWWYKVDAMAEEWMTRQQINEAIVEPCVARLGRMLDLKCGLARAIANSVPFSDVSHVARSVRYV